MNLTVAFGDRLSGVIRFQGSMYSTARAIEDAKALTTVKGFWATYTIRAFRMDGIGVTLTQLEKSCQVGVAAKFAANAGHGWYAVPSNGKYDTYIANAIDSAVALIPVEAGTETANRPPEAKPIARHVRFVSEPTGATVLIDGSYSGVTPTADLRLEEGLHQVTIKRVGYLDAKIEVNGTEGAVKVELKLDTDPSKPKISGL